MVFKLPMVWLLELPSRMLGKVVPTRMPSIGCFKLPMVCIAHGIAQQDHLQCVAHQNVQLKVAHQNASAAASEDDPGLWLGPHYLPPVQQAGHITHTTVVTRLEKLANVVFGCRFVSHGAPEHLRLLGGYKG